MNLITMFSHAEIEEFYSNDIDKNSNNDHCTN